MGNITVGKLKEKLVLESEVNGEPAIVVFPKGIIIEVSSEEEYPDDTTDKDLEDAAKYLKNLDDEETNLAEILLVDFTGWFARSYDTSSMNSLSTKEIKKIVNDYLDFINA